MVSTNDQVNKLNIMYIIPVIFKKLLFLDKDIPDLVKINNIFIMVIAPIFLIYDLSSDYMHLPLDSIITMYSFSILFAMWLVLVMSIGLLYYMYKKFLVIYREDHIATVNPSSNESHQCEFKIYTANKLHKYDNNVNEDDYILLSNSLYLTGADTDLYDNKWLINVFCIIIGVFSIENQEIASYIIENYNEEEINDFFCVDDSQLKKDINSKLLLKNI
jgi:hypothetical protein